MVLSQGIRALYETTHKDPAADLFVKPIKEKGGVI
jgi:hypothetical protein